MVVSLFISFGLATTATARGTGCVFCPKDEQQREYDDSNGHGVVLLTGVFAPIAWIGWVDLMGSQASGGLTSLAFIVL